MKVPLEHLFLILKQEMNILDLVLEGLMGFLKLRFLMLVTEN
jgi:hypothetical protein